MVFKIIELKLSGVLSIQGQFHPDERGYFFEFYKHSEFASYNIPKFVQDNISISSKGTIRGLHFQVPPFEQGKLVSVLRGKILDVAVDIRPHSKTYGQHLVLPIDSTSPSSIYIPPGFAHGFCALEDDTILIYKNTKEYSPKHSRGIIWNDPNLKIQWPLSRPILSRNDSQLPTLKEFEKKRKRT